MKKQLRILLFAALVAILVVMTALVISADYTVTDKNGENATTHTTLADAVAAVTDGGTITVNGDGTDVAVDLTRAGVSYTITGGDTMKTLTLTGKALGGQQTLFYMTSGTVTLRNLRFEKAAEDSTALSTLIYFTTTGAPVMELDNVQLDAASAYGIWIHNKATLTIGGANTYVKGGTTNAIRMQSNWGANAASVTINGGEIDGAESGAAILVHNHQTLTINGGAVIGGSESAITLMDYNADKTKCVLISGGSVSSATSTILVSGACCSVQVTGGTVSTTVAAGDIGAIHATLANTISISGGTVSATVKHGIVVDGAISSLSISGEYNEETETWSTQITGGSRAIYMLATATLAENGEGVVIEGGYMYGLIAVQTKSALPISMTGGDVRCTNAKYGYALYVGADGGCNISISGGTIVSSGYHTVALDGKINRFHIGGDALIEGVGGDYRAIYVTGTKLNAEATGIEIDGGVISTVTYRALSIEADGNYVKMTGGTIRAAKNYALYLSGNSTFDMMGGAIMGNGDISIVMTGSATCNISGGKVLAQDHAVQMESATATLNVSGGVLRAGANSTFYFKAAATVNVTGGTVICSASTEGTAIFRADSKSPVINVSGGVLAPIFTGVIVSDGTVNVLSTNFALVSTEASLTFGGSTYDLSAANGVMYGSTACNVWAKYSATNTSLMMDAGASVRVTAEESGTGIRFISSISAALAAEADSFGTLIAPLDYVIAAANGFTKASLDAYKTQNSIATAVYVEIPAVNTINVDGDIVTFSGALVNIKTGNAERQFAAVPYVVIDGEYSYGEFDSTKQSNSIKAIATEALGAVDAGTQDYFYPSIIEAGKYSKYTEDQQRFLNKYAGLTAITE